MPMKRLITLLSVALPVLLSSCSDEEDILPEQRGKIVSYLERTHTPTLVSEAGADEEGQLPFYTTAGSTVYRYIINYYRPNRESYPAVTAGPMSSTIRTSRIPRSRSIRTILCG